MVARVGALVLAVAMVVGSLALRSRIDRSRTSVRLTCATELADACHRIGQGVKVTVEPAGQTADRLAALDPGADPELDGWLTPGPWAQMVDATRTASGREPLFGAQAPLRLGETQVGVVAGANRAAILAKQCPQVTWACVADAMQADPSHADNADPATEATGPLVLAAMTGGLATDDPTVQTRLANLQKVRTLAADDAISALLTTNGADINLVGALDAEAQVIKAQAANQQAATVLYPAPVTTAEAVLGIVGTGKAAAKARQIVGGDAGVKALRDTRWADTGSTPGATTYGPDVLAALRAEWEHQ